MEATTRSALSAPNNSRNTAQERWQRLGSDRLYTLARWLVIAILFGLSPLLSKTPLLPFSLSTSPFNTLLWAYTTFSALMTLALFIPLLDPLLHWAFLFDVMFLTVFAALTDESNGIFFSLYILPLIGSALRLRSAASLVSGCIAAFFYASAYLFSLSHQGGISRLDYATVALRAVAIAFTAWFASSMAERWSDTNRRKVDQAQLQTEDALRKAQSYLDQMRSLYEVAYTLSTTMNYRKVLDSALLESYKLVPYTAGMIMLSTGKANELHVVATRGESELDHGRSLTISNSAISSAMSSGNPLLLSDVSHDLELESISSLRSCSVACVIPLRAASRTYGLMLVASDRPNAFRQEQVEMLATLANYAIIALHNAQLLFDLREERNKLISKEEEVRRQLARDLHDGPAQALAAITMNVEFIKRLLERDPSRVVDELNRLGALAKRTTHEVRTMLFELRPLVLETQGLRVALEEYLSRFHGSGGTELVLDTKEAADVSLDTKTESTLFNIIQEAINNALKHAKAKHIWVRLKREGNMLTTTVQDDGKGFDLAKVKQSYEKRGSFGLLNIEERARLVGGTAEMYSATGEGTTVRVLVPLE